MRKDTLALNICFSKKTLEFEFGKQHFSSSCIQQFNKTAFDIVSALFYCRGHSFDKNISVNEKVISYNAWKFILFVHSSTMTVKN
jgi:hypothetical protein